MQILFNNEALPDHMTMKQLWLSRWFGKVGILQRDGCPLPWGIFPQGAPSRAGGLSGVWQRERPPELARGSTVLRTRWRSKELVNQG